MGRTSIIPPRNRPRKSLWQRIKSIFSSHKSQARNWAEVDMGAFPMPSSVFDHIPPGIKQDYTERREERLDGYAELSDRGNDMSMPSTWSLIDSSDGGSWDAASNSGPSSNSFDGFGGGDGGGGGATGEY